MCIRDSITDAYTKAAHGNGFNEEFVCNDEERQRIDQYLSLIHIWLVQRRLGEYDKALESYSFALNFAPLAVPILLDRAAITLEMGNTDRAYTDYCQVLAEDKQNKEALLMRAYIYVIRRDYPCLLYTSNA